jgi:ribosomal protein S18 acetylase RimI-like enzyme
MIEVRQLTPEEALRYRTALANVLHDCVTGGASVSFMPPFSLADAEGFFDKVIQGVTGGDRLLLAAFLDAQLVGTVQILLQTPPNQPHRADITKLLVHRSARGQGVAQKLMEQVEEASRKAGKTLLVLDTATGQSAERLYTRMGWTRVGVIPNYALFPDGSACATTIFYKQLE